MVASPSPVVVVMHPGLATVARSFSFLLAVTLAACTGQPPVAGSSSDGNRLQVVTTILPLTLFTRAVAGDCATVTPLIPSGVSPHDVQARPGDLVALGQARVMVINGLGLETFLDKLVTSAANPNLVVIDTSRGVTPLADGEDGVHSHDQAHNHGPVNPHIWLDPLRAVQQVAAIRDGLVKVDPGCAASYRRNAAAYTAQLRQLNAEIADQLRPYAGQTFVAFHNVAPYFADRYGLKATFVVDLPEQNPSPADLKRVASQVKASQLKALLSEPQIGNRSFNALAQDLGVRVAVFDPLETASEGASRDPATYLTVMRRNGAELLRAIKD
ncbi:MAG: zinc ABC transporter substrate-binding protein [Cyanobacteriota bacterium]|nr:zinc ABC transporter substrate-binding protein [Cyanobacteriota bacterium]